MENPSDNFTLSEAACNCGCGQTIIQPLLYEIAEDVRAFLGKPMKVHCINRCISHNREIYEKLGIKEIENSQHITGSAMDFHCIGMSIPELHRRMEELYDMNVVGCMGLYKWGCHIDTRNKKRKWYG